MSNDVYRSFRFVHPEWEEALAARPGLQIAPTGKVDMVKDEFAVRQSILILLSTSPGERLMRPEYGCRIHWLVFAPNDDTTAGLAIHYVGQALRRWEPRVDVLKIDANRDPDEPGQLVISIQYRLKATKTIGELEYPFRLPGEEI